MTDPLKGLATPISEMPGSRGDELPSDLASFMEPTTGEKAREVGIGLGEGVVRGGTLAGSIFTGARLGAMTSPVTGPAGPDIGGLGGLAYGLYASDALSNLFPATSRPELKPYREGAKTLAKALEWPRSGLLYLHTRAQASSAKPFLPLVNTHEASPAHTWAKKPLPQSIQVLLAEPLSRYIQGKRVPVLPLK